MVHGYEALTDKEKQTLRLILRGYDAKSMARHLGLSVHTINERLRYARRKMSVSSSREAARLLLEEESNTPEMLADKSFGEASSNPAMPSDARPDSGRPARRRLGWAIGGITMIALAIAALALSQPAQVAQPADATATAAAVANGTPVRSDVVQAALGWLALVDQDRWSESWQATGESFRKVNTSDRWAQASDQMRAQLGAMISRTLISEESVPAAPNGEEIVKFRTSFAKKANAVETVALVREDAAWKVAGIIID